MLQALANQHEEIHELQALMATLQGKTYTPEALSPVPDLQTLHPWGADRFSAAQGVERLADQLHQNALTDTVHGDLIGAGN